MSMNNLRQSDRRQIRRGYSPIIAIILILIGTLLGGCGAESDALSESPDGDNRGELNSDAGTDEVDSNSHATDAANAGDGGPSRNDAADDDAGHTTPDGGGDGGVACLDDETFFLEEIWQPVVSSNCVGCHVESGLAGGSNLILIPDSGPESLAANYEALATSAMEDVGGTSLLLLKPTGRHPSGHGGGALIDVESSSYRALAEFVARVNGTAEPCSEDSNICATPWPGHRRLRLLTRYEYGNTLTTILGDDQGWSARFAPEPVVDGFDNHSDSLSATVLNVEQWLQAAEAIADHTRPRFDELAACSPTNDGERACARRFVEQLGAQLFRRPLDADDVARYMDIYDFVAAEDGHEEGLRDVTVSLLISPHFLYRTELGIRGDDGVYQLSPYEIASELSYLFWGTSPDAELWAAAQDGSLTESDVIEEQAQRLLSDPRAEEAAVRFMMHWLELERLMTVPRDAAIFPGFDATIREAMREEAEHFLALSFDGGRGDVASLLTNTERTMSEALVNWYGYGDVAAPIGGDEYAVDDPRRPGVLGLGALLATHSVPTSSSPIHRGKVVRERLLCQPLPPPPPGVQADPPQLDPTLTTRERFSAHSDDPVCASCHRLVDPIGFSFEHFDGVGRWVEMENGLPIDASGEIVDSNRTDGTFDGVDELAGLLASTDEVEECLSTQWFRYGYGMTDNSAFQCTSDALAQTIRNGGSFEELLLAMTRTPHFTTRASDEETPESWNARYAPDEPADAGEDAGTTDAGMIDAGFADAGTSDAGSRDASSPDSGATDSGSVDSGSHSSSDEVIVDVAINTDWGGGYCAGAIVTNEGSTTVTWEVTVEVGGTLTDFWNSVTDDAGGSVRFRGEVYNSTLSPGASTEFGFCASR